MTTPVALLLTCAPTAGQPCVCVRIRRLHAGDGLFALPSMFLLSCMLCPFCRRIAVSLLPQRREADLILYYYNVWKTRATPRARAWFTALEQVRWLPLALLCACEAIMPCKRCLQSEQQGLRCIGPGSCAGSKATQSDKTEAHIALRSSSLARQHVDLRYSCRAQARKAQEAEEAAERARLAEAEARRVAAQVQAVQNRQLRDAVAWLRASAKWPRESLPRRACPPCVRAQHLCECQVPTKSTAAFITAIALQPAGTNASALLW
jgi:hypothetical protein